MVFLKVWSLYHLLTKMQFSEFYTGPIESDSLKEKLKILHFNKLPRCTLNFEKHCPKQLDQWDKYTTNDLKKNQNRENLSLKKKTTHSM